MYTKFKNNFFNLKNFITFLFFFIIILFFVNLFFFNIDNFYTFFGDGAFFVDLIDELGNNNKYDSSIHRSHLYIFPFLLAEVQDYCAMTLENAKYLPSYFKVYDPSIPPNMLAHGHLYLLAPIISLFVKIGFSALAVSSFLFSASYVLILYLIFDFLKNKMNIFLAIFFVIVIISFPPLSLSFIGQFYFDRLFILPMLLIIFLYYSYFTENKKNTFTKIILVSILTCLLHERAFLMVGFFLVTYSLLMTNFKVYKDKKVFILFLFGLFCIFTYFFYTKNFQDNFYWGNTIPSQLYANLLRILDTEDILFKQSVKLFFIVLPLVLLSFKNKKLFLIASISLIPQFLVTVGGAEKYALTTHYHAFYIPFLVAAATIGFCEYIRDGIRYKKLTFFYLLFIIIYNSTYNYSKVEEPFSFRGNLDPSRLTFYKSLIHLNYKETNEYWYQNRTFKNKEIKKLIEENKSISAPENFFPYLSTYNHIVDVFPFGVGQKDYVLLELPVKDDIYSMAIPTFMGPEVKNQVADCIMQKLQNQYEIIFQETFLDGTLKILYRLK